MEVLPHEAFRGGRLERPGNWIIGAFADWCPFCRAFAPRFARLEKEAAVPLARLDLSDTDSPLWEELGIEVVPALLAVHDGEVVFHRDAPQGVGLREKDVQELLEATRRPPFARPPTART